MIHPIENNIGHEVEYITEHSKPERGVITSFNDRFVFVRYGNDTGSKATRHEDLQWVNKKDSCDHYYVQSQSKWTPMGSAACQFCGDEIG